MQRELLFGPLPVERLHALVLIVSLFVIPPCLPALEAREVPFAEGRIVSTNLVGGDCVCSADMDGDDRPDVLVSLPWLNTVAWSRNVDGSGTNWEDRVITTNFSQPQHVYAGDMDGDGDTDVIGAAFSGNEVAFWENADGSGLTWVTHLVSADFNGASCVHAADIDGDGDPDILGTAHWDNQLAWWENTGGTWDKHLVVSDLNAAWSVYGADLDQDGDMDVIGGGVGPARFAWWENANGSGTNWVEHTLETNHYATAHIHVGDVDSDGDPDILDVRSDQGDIVWWENPDMGSNWTVHAVTAGLNWPSAGYFADIDGDGDPDVIGASYAEHWVRWWENADGHGRSWVARPCAAAYTNAHDVCAADLDHDHDMDIIGAGFAADVPVTWWENELTSTTGMFGVSFIVDPQGGAPRHVQIADIDGDGDGDIVRSCCFDDHVSWWENIDGHGVVWTQYVVDRSLYYPQAVSVAAGDMDRDGDTDIVYAKLDTGTIEWRENSDPRTTNWVPHGVVTNFSSASDVATGDINKDGHLDVLGLSIDADGDVRWWANPHDAGGTWTGHVVDADFGGGASVCAADVDGDGALDVIGAALIDNLVAWWQNTDGHGTNWSERTVDNAFTGAFCVCAADVDGDGDVDFAGAARGADTIRWWRNVSGDGWTWEPCTVSTAMDFTMSVCAEDLDNDGDIDLAATAHDGGILAWWENLDAAGSNWLEHIVSLTVTGAQAVCAGDIDGDGDADLALAVESVTNRTAWFENRLMHRSALYARQHKVDTSFSGAWAVHAGDMNGDGRLDVLAGSEAVGMRWFRNEDNSGTNWTSFAIPGLASVRSVHAADVDGDGDLDALGMDRLGTDVSWWDNAWGDGTHWTTNHVDTNFVDPRCVTAGDMDGDGDTDILAARANNTNVMDDVVWWENTDGRGTGAWIRHTVEWNLDWALTARPADMDRDGDLDIVVAGWQNGEILWYENSNGVGTVFARHAVNTSLFWYATDARAADVDGDGDMDLVGAAYYSGAQQVRWWENTDGSATNWLEHIMYTDADGASAVYAGDLDGDGDVDIAASADESPAIQWWENVNGQDKTWEAHLLDIDASYGLDAGDIDRDGDLDLFCSLPWESTIGVLENQGGQFALATADDAPEVALEADRADILNVNVFHRGRPGDSYVKTATLELLFEEGSDDPLSSAEANALIENLFVYAGGRAGTLVATVTNLVLSGGALTVTFAIDDPDTRVACGTTLELLVAVELTANAAQQSPSRFRITHLTETSSSADDWSSRRALDLEFTTNLASTIMQAIAVTNDTDHDGMPDFWEYRHFGGITNADAASHGDSDPFPNGEEWACDTDPTNPASLFEITAIANKGSCSVWFACSTARVYSLQCASNLPDGNWLMIDGQTNRPGQSPGPMSLADTNAADRFSYRVRVQTP